MPYSYNNWSASPDPEVIGINVGWEPVPGHRFPGGIRGGDVQVIFTYLVQQLHERVEPIELYPPGDEWGYAYRDNVNNPGQLSCHASGTAIDYNATRHPNQILYTWTREQSLEIHQIIDDELDGIVKWLEGWDEMHFEIRGTAEQVKAVADKIRTMSAPPAPSPDKKALMYKIAWIKKTGSPGSAYRVLYAEGKNGVLYPVEAYNISGKESLERWRTRLDEVPSTSPLIANTFIRIMDGPYANV